MTTVIVISRDSSVIINSPAAAVQLNRDFRSRCKDDDDQTTASPSPSKSSFSSEASDMLECQSPDSAFPARTTEKYRSRRKESLYTTDSDWEELNVSSSSAASTLSSRTSGVSSGTASGSSQDSSPAEGCRQRKFPTMNRPRAQQAAAQRGLSRAQSFSSPARFLVPAVPAATSAYRQEAHHSKFLTSTPLLRLPTNSSSSLQADDPPLGKPARLPTKQAGPGKEDENVSSQSPSSTYSIQSSDSSSHSIPSNQSSNHSSHSKGSLYSTPSNLSSNHTTPYNHSNVFNHSSNYSTPSSQSVLSNRSSNYSTPAGNSIPYSHSTPSGHSMASTHSMASSQSLGRRRRDQRMSSKLTLSTSSVNSEVRGSNCRLVTGQASGSPVNRNYSRIYSTLSSPGLSSSASYEAVYRSRTNTRLLPIGSVFPSGCHRHPVRLLATPPPPPSAAERGCNRLRTSYTATSCRRCEGARCTCDYRTKAPEQTVITSSSLLLSDSSRSSSRCKDDSSKRASCEQKEKSEYTAEKSSVDSAAAANATANKSAARATSHLSRLGGIVVGSGSRILRRHTTYIKQQHQQPLPEEAHPATRHVHSWHKQECQHPDSKALASRGNLVRRASSASRLSLLFRKDDEEDDDGGGDGGGEADWHSLDRLSLHSQEEDDDSQQQAVCGRVSAWQRGFDNLLSDTYGLFKFTEFLKQEFSHENIYFWCACERYRLLADGVERLTAARNILERHLEAGAAEPVNVDWTVRADSGRRLAASTAENPPPPELFLAAQRQIYNLMKFDSYPRFLKSSVYADCLKQELRHGAGLWVTYSQPDSTSSVDRARSVRAAGGAVTNLWSSLGRRGLAAATSSARNEQDHCDLTRVILPDGSTSVVSTTTGESIRALVARLLDKRGLRMVCFDVFATRDGQQLDLSEDCDTLGCREVRVEQRLLLRLQLPNNSCSLGIKARPGRRLAEVVGPVIRQYGWRLDEVDLMNGDMKLDVSSRLEESGQLLVARPRALMVRENVKNASTAAAAATDPELSLYEGLQIMRKGRLEDQRGTEINCEIPDFLKQQQQQVDTAATSDPHAVGSL